MAKVLLYRIIDAIGNGLAWLLHRMGVFSATKSSPARTTELRTAQADCFELDIDALRWNMRSLVITLIAVILFGGALSVASLIMVDLYWFHVPTILVLSISAMNGLVFASLFFVIVRARKRTWKITLDALGIRADCGPQSWAFPFNQLVRVELRQQTDYARLVLVSPTCRLSLLSNLMALDSHPFPAFPRNVERQLQSTGLLEQSTKKNGPDLKIWLRPR